MIKLVTYASAPIYEQLRLNIDEAAHKYSGMEHIPYTEEWLRTTEYYTVNKSILDEKRGAGYWSWKPFIILDTLDTCSKDDVVVYLDSSTVIQTDPTEWMLSVKDMCLVITEFINKDWTKRDCFQAMKCDSEEFWNGNQVWAGIVCCRPTKRAYTVLSEWLYYCMCRCAVTDDESKSENFPSFIDHRHDQSILSILAIGHNIPRCKNDFFKDIM